MDEKRDKLWLAVAKTAFTNGVENITIKNVAKEFGKSESLIYKYCEDKDDLLHKTFEYAREVFISRFDEKAAEEINGEEQVEKAPALLWRFYIKTILSMSYLGYFFTEYTELMSVSVPHQDRIFIEVPTGNKSYDGMCLKLKERVEGIGLTWEYTKRMISDFTVLNVLRELKKGRNVSDEDISCVMLFQECGIKGLCNLK